MGLVCLQLQTFLIRFWAPSCQGKSISGSIFISDGILYVKDSQENDIEFSTGERWDFFYKKFESGFFTRIPFLLLLLSFCSIPQSDSTLPCIFPHRSHITSKCGKNKKKSHILATHFVVFCDLLLFRPTATWNQFVLHNKEAKND